MKIVKKVLMYKIDRRGAGSKNRSLGRTRVSKTIGVFTNFLTLTLSVGLTQIKLKKTVPGCA